MLKHQEHLPQIITRVAIVIATLVAFCLPVGYFALSYQYQTGGMQSAAEFNAKLTTQYIALNPDMWQFQVLRLKTLIETDHTDPRLPEQRRILNQAQQVIVTNSIQQESPYITVRAELYDAGKVVGYVEVIRSLRPLLLETVLVGLIALLFAAAVYVILKLLPLRALNRALASLRQSEELFRKAFHASPDAEIIYRLRDGFIINVNHSFSKLTGYPDHEVRERSMYDLNLMHLEGNHNSARRLLKMPQGTRNQEITLITKHGDQRDMLLSTEITEIGDEICLLLVARDVTEQKHAEKRLAYLANYDHLTGLPNRVLFRDRLTRAMQRAQRSEHLVGLLYLDLDRFKQVNDSLGHQVGDQLLQQVTERLQKCMRGSDSLVPTSLDDTLNSTVARLGGDEFTIILENIKHIDEISRVAQRILTELSVPYLLDVHSIYVGASIGITVYPFDDPEMDNLIRNADIAMYRAKALGRNNFQFYTDDLNANAEERLMIEMELRQALEQEQFQLYYQSKLDLQTQCVTGVEALLRWNSPRLGLVKPDDFIPFLEDSGLIVPVGAWVLRTACTQAAAWARQGITLNVAVNLSARQFRDQHLIHSIETILQETGFPAELLELEVTESMLMEDSDSSQATLSRIKLLGIHISVDDFGTGYSSLAYLKRFPLDSLKIDRSFVHDLGVDPDDTAIVQAVIALAHSLRLSVVAEGVETIEQLRFLRAAHCEHAQGFHINRPMPAADFAAWLAQYQSSSCPSHPHTT